MSIPERTSTDLDRNNFYASRITANLSANARNNLMTNLTMRLFKPSDAITVDNVTHQYSLYSEGTKVESHYFRLNRMYDMRGADRDFVYDTVQQVFSDVIQCFHTVTQALQGNQPGLFGDMNQSAHLQFRLYNRSDNINTNNPSYVQEAVTGGLVTPMLRGSELTVDFLMDVLSKKITSAENWVLDYNTVLVITAVRSRAGGARVPFLGDLNTSKSVVTMKRDSMCAARSLVLLRARLYGTAKDMNAVSKFNSAQQKIQALELHQLAGVEVRPIGVTFTDLEKFADVLQAQIFVVDDLSTVQKGFCYTTAHKQSKKYVLYFEDRGVSHHTGHFSAVTKLHCLFGYKSYCYECMKGYNSPRKDHSCDKVMCMICKTHDCDVEYPFDMAQYSGSWEKCDACNRKFPTEVCFNAHVAKGTCTKVWKCNMCMKNVRGKRDSHDCRQPAIFKCRHCMFQAPDLTSHVCYITPINDDDRPSSRSRIIYFDFETTQYLGPHTVNLAVAMYCDSDEVFVFSNIAEFCQWLFSDANYNCIAIAHNGKGYDFQFIRTWCFNNGRVVNWIATGIKIMTMCDVQSNVRLVDSLNFLPMPLAAFSKTFELTGDFKKGFFPHFFNTPHNLSTYNGPVPEEKYFGVGYMTPYTYKEFSKWHSDLLASNESYDLKKELLEYCVSDVKLLKMGCTVLRDLFIEATSVDPFQQTTIASTCMTVYRKNYMPADTIVRTIPDPKTSVSSKVACEWFHYIAATMKEILTLVSGSNPDCIAYGYNPVSGAKVIYHYMSDYRFGNLNVFDPNYYNHKRRMQMSAVALQRTQLHQSWIRKGFVIIHIWHSEWVVQRDTDPVQNWLNSPINQALLPVMPLNPRHAFFGGRTDAMKLKYTFDEAGGELGCYDDVCSLYPTVNYYDPYPVGVPVVYLRHSQNDHWFKDGVYCDTSDLPPVHDVFGFIKCTVSCPTDLYHPVLPHKGDDGKLLFDLQSPKTGTWATPEIQLALQHGYVILTVHEMWHYDRSYDLFKSYVSNFIQMKQEASGFPPHIEGNDLLEQQYCQQYELKLGLPLNKDRIHKNAGKRALAKLCLNSLWGKFGERVNMTQTKVVYSNDELLRILDDVRYDISYVTPINNIATEVGYRLNEEFSFTDVHIGSVNIPIAAFTTAHARTRLYQALAILQQQVLYYDTDSVLYYFNPNNPGHKQLTRGPFLGDWTSELDGGTLCGTFLSTGPKSYSYQVKEVSGHVKTITKVKGFSKNIMNDSAINHDHMRTLVDSLGAAQIHTNNPHRILLQRGKGDPVVSTPQAKTLSFTYSKRFIHHITTHTIDTLPYGHHLTISQPVFKPNKPTIHIPHDVQRFIAHTPPHNEPHHLTSQPPNDWFHTPSFDELLTNRNYIHPNDIEQLSFIDTLIQ